jgi:hypothetical protein
MMKQSFRSTRAGAAALTLAMLALASVASAKTPAPTAVGQVCRGVMRLEPGETHFDGCVSSLSDSLGRFSEPKAAAVTPAVLENASEARKSWFYVAFKERRRREQQSCALLGFDPASRAFDSCVANLAGTLAAADNPQP